MDERYSEGLEMKSLLPNHSKKQQLVNNKNYTMYLCCLVVLLGTMSVGFMIGITSPLIPDIQQENHNNTPHLDATQASTFGGLLMLGGIAGGLFAGYLMQWIGRKKTSVISAIPYIVGLALIAFATKRWMLFVGRVICGLGAGISSLIVPVYIGEVATSHNRGLLGSATQLCIVTGILIIYGLGMVLPWRWLTAAAAVLPGLLMFLSLFIVETPRYYLLVGQKDKAKSAMQRLRGPNADIEEEYKEIETSLNEEAKPATWWEIIAKKEYRTPTLLSLGAMYFQQLSGINAVMFYAKSLFISAGFTSENQLNLALLAIAGTQVLFTLISCLIIDKTGRRILIIIGGIFMTISLITFGVYFVLLNFQAVHINPTISYPETNYTTTASTVAKGSNLTWMALLSMVVFIASYSIGIGPIAWLLVGEIFPLRSRGKAAGLSTAFNLFLIFLITSLFSSMLKTLTPQGTFWFFAGNCALSVLFTFFFLPETKGKSLEEIEIYFQT